MKDTKVCLCKGDICVCGEGKAAETLIGVALTGFVLWAASKLFKK